jgi:hypothetical protein
VNFAPDEITMHVMFVVRRLNVDVQVFCVGVEGKRTFVHRLAFKNIGLSCASMLFEKTSFRLSRKNKKTKSNICSTVWPLIGKAIKHFFIWRKLAINVSFTGDLGLDILLHDANENGPFFNVVINYVKAIEVSQIYRQLLGSIETKKHTMRRYPKVNLRFHAIKSFKYQTIKSIVCNLKGFQITPSCNSATFPFVQPEHTPVPYAVSS